MTTELRTIDGPIYMGTNDYLPPQWKSEEMIERSYRFIKGILTGNRDKDLLFLFQQVLHQGATPINNENGKMKIPLVFDLHFLIFLDLLDECETFNEFNRKAPDVWRFFNEIDFNELKRPGVTRIIKLHLLQGAEDANSQPDFSRKLGSLSNAELISKIKLRLRDARYSQIFIDALRPEVLDVIQFFQIAVDKASPEELNQYAAVIKKEMIAMKPNPVATHAQWNILMRAHNLPTKGYNDLLFAAATVGHLIKVVGELYSPRIQEINNETAAQLILSLISNKNYKPCKKLESFFSTISDLDFATALGRTLESGDQEMLDLFRPYTQRMIKIQSCLNAWERNKMNAYYHLEKGENSNCTMS